MVVPKDTRLSPQNPSFLRKIHRRTLDLRGKMSWTGRQPVWTHGSHSPAVSVKTATVH